MKRKYLSYLIIICFILFLTLYLHHCTFKPPTSGRFISSDVGQLCAFWMRKGVMEYSNTQYPTYQPIKVINTTDSIMNICKKTNSSQIPNIIWTFWDGKPSKIVEKCIESWKYYNPSYEIRILNKSNYSQYIHYDLESIKHSKESLARYSDYIRLAVLSRHGGIWMDASIICHASFDWLNGIQYTTGCEMIGFHFDDFTTPELLYTSPVIESWFFACVPNSIFMNDWCNEFYRTGLFPTVNDYIKHLQSENINLQNIDMPNYLAIHCAAQKVLQTRIIDYNIVIFSAKNTPYKYLTDAGFDTTKGANLLTDENTGSLYHSLPIIKLRKLERDELETYDLSHAFSHSS